MWIDVYKRQLGVTDALDADLADFSPLTGDKENLYLRDVYKRQQERRSERHRRACMRRLKRTLTRRFGHRTAQMCIRDRDMGGSIGPFVIGFVTQNTGDDLKAGMLAGCIFPAVDVYKRQATLSCRSKLHPKRTAVFTNVVNSLATTAARSEEHTSELQSRQ